MVEDKSNKDFISDARNNLQLLESKTMQLKEDWEKFEIINTSILEFIISIFNEIKNKADDLHFDNISCLLIEITKLVKVYEKSQDITIIKSIKLLFQTIDLLFAMLYNIEEYNNDTGFDDEIKKIFSELSILLLEQSVNTLENNENEGNGVHDKSINDELVVEDELEDKSVDENAEEIHEELELIIPFHVPISEEQSENELPTSEENIDINKPAEEFGDEVVDESEGEVLGESDEQIDEALDMMLQFKITEEMKMQFVQETDELLDRTEQCLIEIERNPESSENEITEAFRAIHTLKGNSGYMGLKDVEKLSHKLEEFLEGIKEGLIKNQKENINQILAVVDILRGAIADFSCGDDGRIEDCKSQIQLLDNLVSRNEFDNDLNTQDISPDNDSENEAVDESTDYRQLAQQSKKTIVRNDIRVDLDKLDKLVNLVGELVIAEALVTQNPAVSNLEDENFDRAVHHLNRITVDLQDITMAVRMIPLANTFRKMIRLVHDLSNKSGKLVKLEIVGEETEVDKNVIELISDPLVHIIRNKVDHGIEMPEERLKQGKPETGTITIEGRHESGEVWIIITDDGRGLDRDKIYTKGIKTGLIIDDAKDIRDEELFNLIFEPGFSTAEKVTDVSGRGMGLDVVKKNIEKLNGRISINSRAGIGTTIILRIPLTLAIIEGMLVTVGSNKYTIPLLSIHQSFKPNEKQVTVTPDGLEIAKVRDELIPVVRIHEVFDTSSDASKLPDGILIIVEDAKRKVCLFVDEIVGRQQTVIKGLSDYIGRKHGVSGCTILGDGQVSLILDIASIVDMAENASNEWSHQH